MFGVRRNLGAVKKGFLQIHELDSRSKIKSGSKDILVDPSTHMIIMHGCYLHNSSVRSAKIHAGEIHKERCAWISCDRYEIVALADIKGDEISYNPKVNPFFALNGKNVDKQEFAMLVTNGVKIILK
jgi:hypothetical protein